MPESHQRSGYSASPEVPLAQPTDRVVVTVQSVEMGRRLADHVFKGVDIGTVLQLKNSGYSLEQIVSLLDSKNQPH